MATFSYGDIICIPSFGNVRGGKLVGDYILVTAPVAPADWTDHLHKWGRICGASSNLAYYTVQLKLLVDS